MKIERLRRNAIEDWEAENAAHLFVSLTRALLEIERLALDPDQDSFKDILAVSRRALRDTKEIIA